MRLTPEVVARAQTHLNPLKERELDLRGLQIPLIENLASYQGSYDTLNLTDNSLTVLGNIPLSPRIRTIHVSNNNISSILPTLPNAVPHLESLILTGNSITSLAALAPLSSFRHLAHLSLLGNPVRGVKHYRVYVIWLLRDTRLHTLDFLRIKDAERAEGKSLFEDEEGRPNALARSMGAESGEGVAAVGAKPDGDKSGKKGKGMMTDEERTRIREAIKKASSVDEVRRLERLLAEGRALE